MELKGFKEFDKILIEIKEKAPPYSSVILTERITVTLSVCNLSKILIQYQPF